SSRVSARVRSVELGARRLRNSLPFKGRVRVGMGGSGYFHKPLNPSQPRLDCRGASRPRKRPHSQEKAEGVAPSASLTHSVRVLLYPHILCGVLDCRHSATVGESETS